jgi:signal transduction histidine kinase/ActR/RegA family two-component response regulator
MSVSIPEAPPMLLPPESQTVSTLMSPLLGVIFEETPFETIVQDERLKESNVMFVVDKAGTLVGSVGSNELIAGMKKKSVGLIAREIMNPSKVSLPSTASHLEANQVLIQNALPFVAITESGKPVGILWAAKSLSAMTQSYSAMFQQLVQTQERLKFRDEFVGILLHDIRSPLGAIGACCDMLKLQNKNLPESQLNFIATIKRNIARCVAMSEDLLHFSKVNDGMKINSEMVEIHSLLGDLTFNLGLVGSQKYGVTLVTNWCGGVGIQVDRMKFGQIIDNLVTNAFKVTPSGKKVTITTSLVDDFKRHNSALRIEITDEGPGIPKAQLKLVFDKYTQLGNQQEAASGVGLGLSIVAQLVRLHNGEIYVEGGGEVAGQGATFAVTLPNASILRVQSLQETIKGHSKILVVDDDEDVRETIVDTFRGVPYEIRQASDGAEGLSLFQAWDPDVVVSDMRMPKKNGLELLYDIRNTNGKTGLILLSGALEDFAPSMIYENFKPDVYLEKPFAAKELLDAVANLLKKKSEA